MAGVTYSAFFLPALATNWPMAVAIFLQQLWPNSMAESTSASVACWAPDFHHHDAFFGAGDHDVDLGGLAFLIGGVGDVLAVDHADADRSQHVMERNVGDGQRRARADDGERRGSRKGSAERTMPMTWVSCA